MKAILKMVNSMDLDFIVLKIIHTKDNLLMEKKTEKEKWNVLVQRVYMKVNLKMI